MTRLIYIANIRLPTEKAHGLQIMQNCEAFTDHGASVELWVARRINTSELRTIHDVWAYYGVKPNFAVRRIPTLDIMPLAAEHGRWFRQITYYLQTGTFTLLMLLRALFTPADLYYSRDPLGLLLLSLFKPRRRLVYEAHMLAGSRGRWMQRQVVRRVQTVIPITKKLAEDLATLAAVPADHFLVARDGIRRERFANAPSQAEARALLNWPPEAFIVGYVGRLQTMSLDKGVGTLIDALKQVQDATLALVGGPDDTAEALRHQWIQAGLAPERFINVGQVNPERVPLYLAALDVCAKPSPWTPHFAYYSSPMKLFEYMASQRAIVASDLPSTAEVVKDGETALLYPSGDAAALAAAIIRLRDNPALRSQLAVAAYEEVMAHYTWAARAQAILARITSTA
jgi:glycosyltransferase involved in cell wall biosynthesis